MKTRKIVLEIPYYSQSVQGIIWDFRTFCKQNNINLKIVLSPKFEKEIQGKGSFARFDFLGKSVLIDVQDNPTEYKFYRDYDYIFKRSFSTDINYQDNVIPLGFRFDVFDGLWLVCFTNIKLFLVDRRNRKEVIRTVLNYIGIDYLGFNNISRSWDNLKLKSQIKQKEKKAILFSTRLWSKNIGEKVSSERKSINELLASRHDVVLNTLLPLKQSSYLNRLEECNVVVINNGLHDVPGIRFPELLLSKKVIVTLPINVVIPGLVDGLHYISTNLENLNSCLDNLTMMTIEQIQTNAKQYAKDYLSPGKRLEYILNKIQ
jgi:hypothetical protein